MSTCVSLDWQRLGHGYQVDASVVLWQQDNVLTVPITSLFRLGEKWMLYAVVDDHVQQREVSLGNKYAQLAQILDGVAKVMSLLSIPMMN